MKYAGKAKIENDKTYAKLKNDIDKN